MNLLLLGMDRDGLAPPLFLFLLHSRHGSSPRSTWEPWGTISFVTCKHLLFGIKRQYANCQRIVAAETPSAWMPARPSESRIVPVKSIVPLKGIIVSFYPLSHRRPDHGDTSVHILFPFSVCCWRLGFSVFSLLTIC